MDTLEAASSQTLIAFVVPERARPSWPKGPTQTRDGRRAPNTPLLEMRLDPKPTPPRTTGIPLHSVFLDQLEVMMVVEVGVDLNDKVAVVVADGDSIPRGGTEVAVANIVLIEVEVVLVVDGAQHDDDNDTGDETPPSLKSVLIGS